MTKKQVSIAIFCKVIDNYGDIGVCWRLARQLAAPPYNCRVYLWADNLHTFSLLEPGINTSLSRQRCKQVEIIHWVGQQALKHEDTGHDIVIEAFACTLPANFIAAMKPSALWLNLEYLTAEPWAEQGHLMPSPQANGMVKYFYFPGFGTNTGGLLREPDLIKQRNSWLADTNNKYKLLMQLGTKPENINAIEAGALLIFLFCYPSAPVQALTEALNAAQRKAVLLTPQGVAACPSAGTVSVQAIPFVPQEQFDHLLWSADLNIVRGEDSLTRAIWAGKPMIWQPYVQEDKAHLSKLSAYLQCSGSSQGIQSLVTSWSEGAHTFSNMLQKQIQAANFESWRMHAAHWSEHLLGQADLASKLLDFHANKP